MTRSGNQLLALDDHEGLLRHSDSVFYGDDDAADYGQFVAAAARNVLPTGKSEANNASKHLYPGKLGRKNILHWNRFYNRPAARTAVHYSRSPAAKKAAPEASKFVKISYKSNQNHHMALHPRYGVIAVAESIQYLTGYHERCSDNLNISNSSQNTSYPSPWASTGKGAA